ncbi:MAG: hypothetical protein EOR26_05225 [Mesorhizobium sp.]|uniref:hypothetical protein n=1 Tax=unclassified Mesorhizobium TaxID=325217 RepID=UPI000FCBADDE|nr:MULTISPECIES: hypothetical protein [unclassified Mesorhizobium]RUV69675.1 hypothetical protein EOA78_22835 [Mesorhizobium sp. M5C.F.Cr.IN.023.01.1.1]RWI51097.1 MAG: hypothetical protein EOR15_06805 [Mesorhizobium sp.]RWI62083.1 MAG: hypothetical protein EOR16_04000 [Mesorhizobium sp.]RWJ13934.1 MAG: hypothetical protein EOR24_01260 [Mesorhizobium sp.]RWJ16841.1 MAG: hypothetical protein EOR25_13185 [Mesorhizobium sp.]
MIEKHSGLQQIVCECGISQRRTYQADEFDVMISDARSEGFVIAKVAGEWQHTCQDCSRPARSQRKLL